MCSRLCLYKWHGTEWGNYDTDLLPSATAQATASTTGLCHGSPVRRDAVLLSWCPCGKGHDFFIESEGAKIHLSFTG